MKDYQTAIDREITFFLREQQMTQEQLANQLGMNVNTLSAKRRGFSEFKVSELLMIAEICGKTQGQLLGMA